MPTNAKCIYWYRSENLSGQPILLTITRHDTKTLEIVVKYITRHNIRRKCSLLLLITVLSIISFMFHIISSNYFIAIFIVILFFIYRIIFSVQQERILIVQTLGYQVEIHYTFTKTIRYIAWQNIKSVFINEVVSKQRVIFILAILTKDSSKEASAIIPLFLETMPRLQCLEAIYQYIENCHNKVLL